MVASVHACSLHSVKKSTFILVFSEATSFNNEQTELAKGIENLPKNMLAMFQRPNQCVQKLSKHKKIQAVCSCPSRHHKGLHTTLHPLTATLVVFARDGEN